MDLRKMMAQAQEMQSQLQEKIAAISVDAEVGAGLVRVTMNGQKQLVKVEIDPELLDPQDPDMVQDLVLAAVNDANRQVDLAIQKQVGGLAPGLGIPGLS